MTRWLTRAEAAARFGRKESTIKRWTKAGDITPVLGRYREDDLLEVDKMMRERQLAGVKQPDADTDIADVADSTAVDLVKALFAAGHGRWTVAVDAEEEQVRLTATRT